MNNLLIYPSVQTYLQNSKIRDVFFSQIISKKTTIFRATKILGNLTLFKLTYFLI